MWDDSEQGIKSMIKACKRDGDKNTLDDLIKGLQELRAKHGNVRVLTDYDCGYSIEPLLVQYFQPVKDVQGKIIGFCVYA